MVIIAVGEVKSAIIIVVRHIVVNHDYGSPGVEDGVGDDGSKGRTADHVVAIDVAAIDTVVEVVGDATVVNRSDMMRDMHVIVIVVVVRVYVGGVGRISSGISSGMSSGVSSGMVAAGLSVTAGLVTSAGVVTGIRAGGRHRLRSGCALLRVSALSVFRNNIRRGGSGGRGGCGSCLRGRSGLG